MCYVQDARFMRNRCCIYEGKKNKSRSKEEQMNLKQFDNIRIEHARNESKKEDRSLYKSVAI